ncbi:ThiF family adenylyltransferase [Pseudorhodoferax sp. Leaf265]|uniref:ThiF family adenylyltransferase n=1 Tax=Pseudorhodoferax sp. Leaf265 TaxID=1736315 RepID=UPI0006FFAEDE|nr:ThiF family adenylyltransferase [Pseudorhodoferax sp. Leaf265]KQP15556.1 hypothetical protein ASF45_28585 [Pseudorhodoferax sp. Leaf265]
MLPLLQDQAQRMARERRLLKDYASATPSFTMQRWVASKDGELCVEFELKLLKGAFAGLLVYPELFPDVPAFVRPHKADEAWSTHQFVNSGVLCLQYGPDNWHPGVTGVDLIRSATTLIWGEILDGIVPGIGPIPSRHEVTDEQLLGAHNQRLLVTTTLNALLAGPGQATAIPFQCVVDSLNGESVAVVVQTGDPLTAVADVPSALLQGPGVQIQGMAVAVPAATALADVTDAGGLQAILGPAWPWSEGIPDKLVFLVAHDPKGQLCSFMLRGAGSTFFQRYHPLAVLHADAPRLPGSFSRLAGVSVAIVGVGSLGSKIAVSLARAGVRDFVLVDDDVLLPQNLVRNEFSWMDVGFSKFAAATRALQLVAPDVAVKSWPVRIAGQGSPTVAVRLAQAVAACTLVVDATANPSAFVALAALTKRAGKALVWGEVFGGGGGALMARSRPGFDADALSIRAHLHGVMEKMAPAPTARMTAYGMETDGVVYVASDADVGSLAASMTQFCLDTLCADPTDYPAAAYLIGFRKFWEFRCPFDVIPVDCPAATPSEPAPHLSDQEQQDLAAIQKSIRGSDGAAHHGSA